MMAAAITIIIIADKGLGFLQAIHVLDKTIAVAKPGRVIKYCIHDLAGGSTDELIANINGIKVYYCRPCGCSRKSFSINRYREVVGGTGFSQQRRRFINAGILGFRKRINGSSIFLDLYRSAGNRVPKIIIIKIFSAADLYKTRTCLIRNNPFYYKFLFCAIQVNLNHLFTGAEEE
jgi:hypothetical protein